MSSEVPDISNLDIGKICRTCLSEGEMQPLFRKCTCTDEEECISEKLMFCTLIQFSKIDGLPAQICLDCIKQIDNSYKFAMKCERSDEILRAYLKKSDKTSPIKQVKKSKKKTKTVMRSKIKTISQEANKELQDEIKTEYENECVLVNTLSRETNQQNDNSRNEVPFHSGDTNQFDSSNTDQDSQSLLLKNESNQSDYEIEELGMAEYYDNKEEEKEIKIELDEIPHKDVKEESSDNIDEEFNAKMNKSFKRLRRTITEEKKMKSVPPYECRKCFMSFPTFKELAEHRQKAQHPKNVYRNQICKVCNKSIGYSKMNEHMRTHTQEKPFCCEFCGMKFSVSNNLRRHVTSKHLNEKPFKCDVCEKRFTRLAILKDHTRTHTGERPFVCNYCGKGFTQTSSLRTHLVTHRRKERNSDLRKYKCEVCDRKFYSKGVLKTHILIHGKKNFLCQHCGRSFASRTGLQSHSKVHTGVRPYICTICNKTFPRQGSLKTHMLMHSGVKPFSCKTCGKAFTQRIHLQYHQRLHSGERPYECLVCGKRFALNRTLTVHKRIHTGETPYVCDICNKGFYDSSSMKKHKKCHPEVVIN